MILNRAGMTRNVVVSACVFSSEYIIYEDGKKACRGSLSDPFRIMLTRGNSSRPRHTILTGIGAPYRVKPSHNTQVMQRTRLVHKQRRRYAPHNISLASCPSERRSGWAVRQFDSLVLNEVPDVALCLCAQGEGAFLRIAPQRYKSKEPPAKRHLWSFHRQQQHRGAKRLTRT